MNHELAPIPVTLICGFLGAGKTTLLNRALSHIEGFRFAVIENEFGALNIDHDLVVRQDTEVIEMSNGCVCCSIRTDLVETLDRLQQQRDKFDGVLVETTGLALPAPILSIFENEDQPYFLNHVITVVDAKNFEQNLSKSEEALAQICCADILVVNKMDQVSEQDREPILERLNTLNPLSSKVFTQNAEVDLRWFTHELKLNVNAILGASIPKGHHHHNHAVGSLAFESQTPLDVEKFEAWLMGLVDEEGMELYRLKGLVDLSDRDQPLIIQAVGCSLEMDDEQVWGERERSTRLVIIGKNLNEAELQRDFKACEV